MSIGIHLDTSAIPVSIGGSATGSSASDASSTQGKTNVVKSAGPGGGTGAASAAGGSDSSSSASPTVQALQRQIAQLQKQLAQEQQQLRAATQRNKGATDPASMAEIAALQSAVTTTTGQLEAAVTALSTALLAEGGSSGGSLVSTSA